MKYLGSTRGAVTSDKIVGRRMRRSVEIIFPCLFDVEDELVDVSGFLNPGFPFGTGLDCGVVGPTKLPQTAHPQATYTGPKTYLTYL